MYRHSYAQDSVAYNPFVPTPLVSISMLQPTRRLATLPEVARQVQSDVVEEEAHADTKADRTWTTGCAGRWTQSDVKWSGYVEYPESCERSSIAREAQHQNTSIMDNDKGRKEDMC